MLIHESKIMQLKNKNKKVKFLVNIPRSQVIEYVKNASVFLLGSKQEIFPVSILEAMASGIPFISTDVGCVRFLPGGFIIHHPEEMKYCLSLLMGNNELRKSLGACGRLYAVSNFRIDSKIDQLEELING